MNREGQAFSAFQLLIAAIVAMAFLAILLPLLLNSAGFFKASPLNETKSLLSEMLLAPGAIKYTQDVVFENGDVLASSSLASGLPLNEDQICLTIDFEVTEFDPKTGTKKGTIMNDFRHAGMNKSKLVYLGQTSATVRIGVVCNKDVDALRGDIGSYTDIPPESRARLNEWVKKYPGLKDKFPEYYGEPTKLCKICEGMGKCCALMLQRT